MVEDVLVLSVKNGGNLALRVLILVVVEDVLVLADIIQLAKVMIVLILVVVEDVLVQLSSVHYGLWWISLNPCCGGRCSSTRT